MGMSNVPDNPNVPEKRQLAEVFPVGKKESIISNILPV